MRTIKSAITGNEISLPDVNKPPMPALVEPGVILDGEAAVGFGSINAERGYPDARSYRRKLGLLIPATNTSVEHELWSIIVHNQTANALRGIGIHTTNVVTPKPVLETEADLLEYKRQFLGGLQSAVDLALLAQPEHLIMGMSLEHIIAGIDGIRDTVSGLTANDGPRWSTWHDAVSVALAKFDAKRIGLITPFDKLGNENATRMFEDLGFDVVSTVGFSCANALHIAHIPDWAKEKAIFELLATPANDLDAVVQCGTNMSMIDVAERIEPQIGIPILGINAVTFWHALRETGINAPLANASRLLREH